MTICPLDTAPERHNSSSAMKTEAAHSDTSRVDTAQRVFLNNRNFDLNPPLTWKVYGDPYTIAS